ncbi:PREDICTED: insulin-like growth factor-binding protein complex acid labile subunit [Priapulus caudatus]|uniref:Insulin-like growth factor-binding protein complex acid labile subunit n=1 Tax=Priapulus caudatus TaxID=37621 RepID=A0ABM1E023_PRICU|nr:PREDICTED: insulin-like growth factor-binding protein complex acid labile subunit [Priapulus caudatus]
MLRHVAMCNTAPRVGPGAHEHINSLPLPELDAGRRERLLRRFVHVGGRDDGPSFGRLQNTTMSRLQISGFGDLTEIPAGMFSGMKIVSLTISSSSRPTMNEQSLAGIRGLTELILTSLQLTELPSVIFPSVSHVEYLHLSYNRFTTLPDRIFSPFTRLRRLFLEFGSLTTIAPNALGGLSTLEYLDLSHNKIGFIEPGLFAEMGQLYTMMLKYNNLHALEAGTFSGLRKVTSLELEYNSIGRIDAGAFENTDGITFLKLFKNKLTSIKAGAFAGLNKLEMLDIIANFVLETIEVGAFHGLPRLSIVYLHFNNLNHLEQDIFDLSLYPESWSIITSISDNPLDCSCLGWLLSKPFDVHGLCHAPADVAGEWLENIDPSDLHCPAVRRQIVH